ncbi:MAG: gliding motility-associated C-terminal domain-containing protein [Bacteroidia bacterium]|nr:gliding motility-associated C-terminal domain-containing protein [Bacteroidia bacterium]
MKPIYFILLIPFFFFACKEEPMEPEETPIEKLNRLACTQEALNESLGPDARIMGPSIFTPDADGINDLFSFSYDWDISKLATYNLKLIFETDSSSQDVFESTDPQNFWDGTLAPMTVQPGIYQMTLKLTYDGQSYSFAKEIVVVNPANAVFALQNCQDCVFPDQLNAANNDLDDTQQFNVGSLCQ